MGSPCAVVPTVDEGPSPLTARSYLGSAGVDAAHFIAPSLPKAPLQSLPLGKQVSAIMTRGFLNLAGMPVFMLALNAHAGRRCRA